MKFSNKKLMAEVIKAVSITNSTIKLKPSLGLVS